MSEDKHITISLSCCMYYSRHEENDEYKDSSLGGKIVTKIVDFCTIPVGILETIVFGTLGMIGIIILSIGCVITRMKLDEKSLPKVVVEILCASAAASAGAVFNSSMSLIREKY